MVLVAKQDFGSKTMPRTSVRLLDPTRDYLGLHFHSIYSIHIFVFDSQYLLTWHTILVYISASEHRWGNRKSSCSFVVDAQPRNIVSIHITFNSNLFQYLFYFKRFLIKLCLQGVKTFHFSSFVLYIQSKKSTWSLALVNSFIDVFSTVLCWDDRGQNLTERNVNKNVYQGSS